MCRIAFSIEKKYNSRAKNEKQIKMKNCKHVILKAEYQLYQWEFTFP
jgi:hypothetical protein